MSRSSVEQVILDDKRSNVWKMAASVEIIVGSFETIIHDHIGYVKILSVRTSFFYLPAEVSTSTALYSSSNALWARWGRSIETYFTMGEKMVYYYIPESKQASMDCQKKDEAGSMKPKTVTSAGKILCTVFFKMRIYADLLHWTKKKGNRECCLRLEPLTRTHEASPQIKMPRYSN